MRLLADENLPLLTVRALRAAGHDVYAAAESSPSAADTVLVRHAVAEDRIIVTFDRDFGALVAMGPTAVPGVLLLRLPPRSAVVVTTLLVNLLARSEVTWLGHLSVVTEEHIRQRKLVRAA
jgi:predicted nuclease of predicted toxin-antitoxin system